MNLAVVTNAPVSQSVREWLKEQNGDLRSSRENTHQLFIRFERSSFLKLDIQLAHFEEITCEGREVVRVIPLPRRSSLEVVFENPA